MYPTGSLEPEMALNSKRQKMSSPCIRPSGPFLPLFTQSRLHPLFEHTSNPSLNCVLFFLPTGLLFASSPHHCPKQPSPLVTALVLYMLTVPPTPSERRLPSAMLWAPGGAAHPVGHKQKATLFFLTIVSFNHLCVGSPFPDLGETSGKSHNYLVPLIHSLHKYC